MAEKRHKTQMKLEPSYHGRLMDFCRKNGATISDVIRFMIDSQELDKEASSVAYDRWFESRQR